MTPTLRSLASRGMTSSMHGPGREVVCAILSGESSTRAVRVAAGLADRLALRLALIEVHVPVPPPQVAPVEGPQPPVPLASAAGVSPLAADQVPVVQGPAEWRRGVVMPRDTRQDAITAAPARVRADFMTVKGDAAEGLGAAARDVGAGLIAVGQPRHGAIGSALLGSALHQLLATGATPVCVISERVRNADAA